MLERQSCRPDFIAKWRVKDLGVFEWTAFGADGWAARLRKMMTDVKTVLPAYVPE